MNRIKMALSLMAVAFIVVATFGILIALPIGLIYLIYWLATNYSPVAYLLFFPFVFLVSYLLTFTLEEK